MNILNFPQTLRPSRHRLISTVEIRRVLRGPLTAPAGILLRVATGPASGVVEMPISRRKALTLMEHFPHKAMHYIEERPYFGTSTTVPIPGKTTLVIG